MSRFLVAAILILTAAPAVAQTTAGDETPAVRQIGVWPVKAFVMRKNVSTYAPMLSRQMMQGFADGNDSSVLRFHEGIDIWVDGKGGENQHVVVSRAGTVKFVNKNQVGGTVLVEVDVGGGKKEYDWYQHVGGIKVKKNDVVAAGKQVGFISNSRIFRPGARHLHMAVTTGFKVNGDRTAAAKEESYRNPFMRFKHPRDRDPFRQKPRLEDTNGDGKTLLIVRSGQAKPIKKQPIKGDVDIIADLRDPMNMERKARQGAKKKPKEAGKKKLFIEKGEGILSASAPHTVGYWVEALFDKPAVKAKAHGVKTADSPYLLSKFDDEWFAGKPKSTGKYPLVYDLSRTVEHEDPYTALNRWKMKSNFIVTNTKGTDGLPVNVDGDQYWNTNAKDDGKPDTVAHANYAGKPDARKNAQGRFLDGDYVVHIIAGDLVDKKVDMPAGRLRLDNFKQRARAGRGGRPSVPPVIDPIYRKSKVPWVPDFLPEPEVAGIDEVFLLGDPVGIVGDEYYPNLDMPAFIFPHRGAWRDGMVLNPAAAIAFIGVESDATGFVPLTFAWTADRLGRFDVIIDYDRDGLFSWTLDGLGGFKVIPAPGTLVLLVVGAGVTGRRRRAV